MHLYKWESVKGADRCVNSLLLQPPITPSATGMSVLLAVVPAEDGPCPTSMGCIVPYGKRVETHSILVGPVFLCFSSGHLPSLLNASRARGRFEWPVRPEWVSESRARPFGGAEAGSGTRTVVCVTSDLAKDRRNKRSEPC